MYFRTSPKASIYVFERYWRIQCKLTPKPGNDIVSLILCGTFVPPLFIASNFLGLCHKWGKAQRTGREQFQETKQLQGCKKEKSPDNSEDFSSVPRPET